MKIPIDLQGSGDIRVIGDRGSGKTCYLAALAHWPNADPDSSAIQSVDPFDEDTGTLISMAQNILENGLPTPPTKLETESDADSPPREPPLYTLLIELKPRFVPWGRNVRFQISSREYAGELMQQLCKGVTPGSALSNYLDDCAEASGILLLIDGTSKYDKQYAEGLDNLQRELNFRLTNASNRNRRNYRIAVVFSKGEQPQVWNYRQNLKDLRGLKFPRTEIAIQKWSKAWRCSVAYFICSAFGMIGNPPIPNVKIVKKDRRGSYGVIARPKLWKPFGLVAPIYWLHTGKQDPRLQEI